MIPDEQVFQDFLEEALRWTPEPLTLHECLVIVPTRLVSAHAAECLGRPPRYEEVAAMLKSIAKDKA